jgi:hypothetical protein
MKSLKASRVMVWPHSPTTSTILCIRANAETEIHVQPVAPPSGFEKGKFNVRDQ